MSKKLKEAWITICRYNNEIIHDMCGEYVENPLEEEIDIVNNALQRLEAIDNANPSEVSFIWLNQRITRLEDDLQHYTMVEKDKALASITEKELNHLTAIKQALLKSQEQEKENELLKEIIKSLFDSGCPLHQYIDSKGGLQIEVDYECSNMILGEHKGVDLDKFLKEVLNNE